MTTNEGEKVIWGDFDTEKFWDTVHGHGESDPTPVDDDLVARIEEKFGFKLPQSYIEFMRTSNGGRPVATRLCHPATPTSWAQDHVAIDSFFPLGPKHHNSILQCYDLWHIDWEYPKVGLPLASCPSAGHDLIFLDYTKCGNDMADGEPRVVHIDQEFDYTITVLAPSFEKFVRGLCNFN